MWARFLVNFCQFEQHVLITPSTIFFSSPDRMYHIRSARIPVVQCHHHHYPRPRHQLSNLPAHYTRRCPCHIHPPRRCSLRLVYLFRDRQAVVPWWVEVVVGPQNPVQRTRKCISTPVAFSLLFTNRANLTNTKLHFNLIHSCEDCLIDFSTRWIFFSPFYGLVASPVDSVGAVCFNIFTWTLVGALACAITGSIE